MDLIKTGTLDVLPLTICQICKSNVRWSAF